MLVSQHRYGLYLGRYHCGEIRIRATCLILGRYWWVVGNPSPLQTSSWHALREVGPGYIDRCLRFNIPSIDGEASQHFGHGSLFNSLSYLSSVTLAQAKPGNTQGALSGQLHCSTIASAGLPIGNTIYEGHQ
jgi:hypothetical protein